MAASLSDPTPFAFGEFFEIPGSFNPTLILLAVAAVLMLIRKPPRRDKIRIRIRK
ncbi:MAG: hypothetical protein AAFP04_09740 [Myxococcota bacterium]